MKGRRERASPPKTAGAKEVAEIEELEKAWCDAWNAHDMKALADLLLPEVDFVTVGGRWLRGRAEFTAHTGMMHATQFRDSRFSVLSVLVKPLGAGLALTHVRWRLEGDYDPDGTPRKPRTGIFTQVLRKSGRKWFILASQNTNESFPQARTA